MVPPDRAEAFAPGFSPANYETVLGQFPTANIFLEDGLTSPIVKEFTLSYGADLKNGRGYAEVSFIAAHDLAHHRRHDHARQRRDERRQGRDRRRHVHQRHLPEPGHRQIATYQGLLFQGRYNIRPRWSVNGHYTAANQEQRQQRGRGGKPAGRPERAWATTRRSSPQTARSPMGASWCSSATSSRCGASTISGLGRPVMRLLSGLWRVNSGTTYSLVATGQPLTRDSEGADLSVPG